AAAERQVDHERGHRGDHRHRPEREEGALLHASTSSIDQSSLDEGPLSGPASFATRSAARSLALLARRLSAISASLGTMGFFVRARHLPRSGSARFTSRSSSEWNEMTAITPPSATTLGA